MSPPAREIHPAPARLEDSSRPAARWTLLGRAAEDGCAGLDRAGTRDHQRTRMFSPDTAAVMNGGCPSGKRFDGNEWPSLDAGDVDLQAPVSGHSAPTPSHPAGRVGGNSRDSVALPSSTCVLLRNAAPPLSA